MRRHCLGWLFTTGLLVASVSLPAQVRTPDIRVDEVGFGEAWLRATRSQLNERVDPLNGFVLRVQEHRAFPSA